MKKYTSPNMKITAFDIEDIITASANVIVNGVIVNKDNLSGEDASMYDVYTQGSSIDSENVSIFTW